MSKGNKSYTEKKSNKNKERKFSKLIIDNNDKSLIIEFKNGICVKVKYADKFLDIRVFKGKFSKQYLSKREWLNVVDEKEFLKRGSKILGKSGLKLGDKLTEITKGKIF